MVLWTGGENKSSKREKSHYTAVQTNVISEKMMITSNVFIIPMGSPHASLHTSKVGRPKCTTVKNQNVLVSSDVYPMNEPSKANVSAVIQCAMVHARKERIFYPIASFVLSPTTTLNRL